jgi:hypothetical protein
MRSNSNREQIHFLNGIRDILKMHKKFAYENWHYL